MSGYSPQTHRGPPAHRAAWDIGLLTSAFSEKNLALQKQCLSASDNGFQCHPETCILKHLISLRSPITLVCLSVTVGAVTWALESSMPCWVIYTKIMWFQDCFLHKVPLTDSFTREVPKLNLCKHFKGAVFIEVNAQYNNFPSSVLCWRPPLAGLRLQASPLEQAVSNQCWGPCSFVWEHSSYPTYFISYSSFQRLLFATLIAFCCYLYIQIIFSAHIVWGGLMKMQPVATLISARISLPAESLIQPRQQPNWHPEHR